MLTRREPAVARDEVTVILELLFDIRHSTEQLLLERMAYHRRKIAEERARREQPL